MLKKLRKILWELKLKEILFSEYSQLNREIQRLSPHEKVAVAGLTKQDSWKDFMKLLDEWKRRIMQKGLEARDEKDVISLHAQCRMIAYLKTLEKRFKDVKEEGIKGTDDPATTVPI